ncbi:putative Cytochrome P450 2J6 [Hypsibius exemplaris]|uniref:Cytochrome P450 2J6 n=1 Tax=Hypsibius exemplaris TaxID=2072580 RepID=A0A1W0X7C1_HYPEX|nr:putative Cytochrome P450 2J6 [Hypsibius exemplaris]
MGMWMPVAGVLITFLIFRKYFTFLWKRRIGELPPGPIPLPVIGNLLDVSRGLPYDAAEKLVRKYGKIVSLMVGDQVTIFIADLPLIRKAFKDDRFSGRPVTIWNYLGLAPNYSHPGIGMEEGEIHREHRKFAEKALRDYGLGTSAGEVFIHQEVSELMQILRDSHGQPMNNAFPFAATVSNVSSYMIYGTSFSPDDPKFIEYIEGDSQVKKESPAGSLLTMFPLLRFIPPFRGSFLRLKSGTVTKHKRVQELIAAHKERFDPNHPRDYIDAYLVAQKSGLASFTDKQLGYNVVDLFGASYGTSTTILRWAMLYMIVYPDVQTKIHEELDRVVGRSRQVAFADRTYPALHRSDHSRNVSNGQLRAIFIAA